MNKPRGIPCRLSLLLALVALICPPARGDVRLAGLFSDDMALQQGVRVPIWGWAGKDEEITVTFRGQSVKGKAKDGKWMVHLARLEAGGPDMLVVQGSNRIELQNVLVGEVWICSGQSNMEWPMSKAYASEQDIASSANPQLRLFLVPKMKTNAPAGDVKGHWKVSGPETVPGFSAVAWYFGRDLQRARQVPVGLIGTYWGGSPAEAWMNEAALAGNDRYRRDILDAYAQALRKFEGAEPKGRRPPWRPAELYNGMIAPLIPYALKGAIWYQGESNAQRAHEYRTLFADMIRNWRHDWGHGDFSFLAVQLAPYDKGRKRTLEAISEKPGDSDWAELREAQGLATRTLPAVGLAVITDIGEKDDIHPKKKEPVGARLALAARGIAYGEKVEYSGPIFKRLKVKGDTATLTFDHVGAGLEARGGNLAGFAICGPDKSFVWAKAEISNNAVTVSNPQVSQPVAVRYGWADFPIVNLWNKDGLPASPFRTDDFPLTTEPHKP